MGRGIDIRLHLKASDLKQPFSISKRRIPRAVCEARQTSATPRNKDSESIAACDTQELLQSEAEN